jgi:hypothetical protein
MKNEIAVDAANIDREFYHHSASDGEISKVVGNLQKV